MTSRGLRTCSEDGDYAVFGGASSSEPDTDEMMDGRASRGPVRAAFAAPAVHAGAAAAAASGIGTTAGDDWLFDIARAPADADAVAPSSVASFQHPGCTGVAAVAVVTETTTATTTATTTTTTTRTATAAVVAGSSSAMDADIDHLLADFKAARELERQKRQQQEDAAAGPQIERVSLASLGAASAAAAASRHPCSSSAAVRFVNALQPLPAADDGPLLFSDGPLPFRAPPPPVAARPVAAVAAARPAAPPPRVLSAAAPAPATTTTAMMRPPAPTAWAPSMPLPGSRTAVVGPGASAAYEDEALSFSRSRSRRPAAAAAATAPSLRHPGM